MAIHIWSVLCAKSSLDRDSNNISLFDVTEQINLGYSGELPQGKVAIAASFELVSFWIRSDLTRAEHPHARVSILGPNGDVSVGPEHQIDLASAGRSRSILKLAGIPISGPGYHYLVVHLRNEGRTDWIEVAKLPLDVQITKVEGAVAPKGAT